MPVEKKPNPAASNRSKESKSLSETSISRRGFLKLGTAAFLGRVLPDFPEFRFFRAPTTELQPSRGNPTETRRGLEIQMQSENIPPAVADHVMNLIVNPPNIGGPENYEKALVEGIGYATTHNQTLISLKNQAAKQEHETLIKAARGTEANIIERCTADLSHMGMLEALDSGLYSGLLALRSAKNLGDVVAVLAVSAPDRGRLLRVKFVGPALVVDLPQEHHYKVDPGLSSQRYKHMGWEKPPWHGVQWIADLSPSLMTKLYPGLSGDPNNIKEGKVLIVVRRNKIKELLRGEIARLPQ